MMDTISTTRWDTGLYDDKHSFVWKHGASLDRPPRAKAGRADPRPRLRHRPSDRPDRRIGRRGRRHRLLFRDDRGGHGVSSRAFRFEVADARDFSFDEPFDAVFSNAVLHWVKPPEKAIACIRRALKPGGRFVAEFGGRGNVAAIVSALDAASRAIGLGAWEHPWYYPGIGEYAPLLERAGLEVTHAVPLRSPDSAGGRRAACGHWVEMFVGGLVGRVPPGDRERFFRHVEDFAAADALSRWHRGSPTTGGCASWPAGWTGSERDPDEGDGGFMNLFAIPVLLAGLSAGAFSAVGKIRRRRPVDRVGFPKDYREKFQVLRRVNRPEKQQVVTVYGNKPAATIQRPGDLPYPYGSIIVMETAGARKDAHGKPLLDAEGYYRKEQVIGLHVMRREKGFGAAYGKNRTGEWEYVEYRADSSYITPPRSRSPARSATSRRGESETSSTGEGFRPTARNEPSSRPAPSRGSRAIEGSQGSGRVELGIVEEGRSCQSTPMRPGRS